ncbi:MAG: ParA family protein [Bacteroides sp.]|nr:ParA family protein [Bacteroides sp.]
MMQTPVIVTFANQKGGVGKTTLCVTFANYLVTKGVRVIIVDCDFQHSIVKCRKSDITKYGADTVPYDVVSADSNNRASMIELIERLHNEPIIEVALMDSPGHLLADGLPTLFANSDIIVVPFRYDDTTMFSTKSFLYFIDRLRNAMGGRMKTRLFLVPNLTDARVGKRAELLKWEEDREELTKFGEVTRKMHKRADMERFSSIASLDMQNTIVSPVFDRIYAAIFDTIEPLRQNTLSGIQLHENVEPKSKRKSKTGTGADPPAVKTQDNANH